MSFAGSAAAPAQFPRDGLPEVALLGRSNVGKSSLLNALARTKGLARVSATPGRTQTVNFYRVGHELYFADLPGYGYARVPEPVRRGWERLVRSYLEDREPLALGVLLLDARHEPGEADGVLRGYLRTLELPYVVADTKSDKLGRAERARRREALRRGLAQDALDVVAVSAVTREGIDELWRAIRAALPAPAGRAGAARS